jgi:uncharacterized repeat protein (TIGR03803 family)
MSTNYVSRVALAAISCTGLIVGLLNAVPAQAQTPTTVYGFPGTPGPVNPNIEALTQGRDGELYLTAAGGDGKALNCTVTYCGAAFKITPAGAVSDLFDFSNNNCTVVLCGYDAYGGLTLGTDGNFYGAFYEGGNTGTLGAVFKLTPAGVLTLLHSFTGVSDGSHPYGAPIEGTNGIFYGTTTSASNNSTAYSVTSAGVFKTLHTFTGTDGQNVYAPLVQGTDGNFYGDSAAGGKSNDGVIFKMTPSGTVTVLHNFAGTDGSEDYYPLIQASDGNFYGTSYAGGTDSAGVVFKITPSGTYTVLHNINGTTDGNGPAFGLVQATNGKLYGVTSDIEIGLNGTIFSITTSGTFTTLYSFTGGKDGGDPLSPLVQHTDGLLYGTTNVGGDTNCFSVVNISGEPVEVAGCGELYSLNIGAKPFLNLSTTSGRVGSTVGIFGQEFSSSSVAKFNGVTATKITLAGTTYITATVPAGATDGKITVTTGTTTLTSTKTFIVHNSWSSGKAVPVAVAAAATGFINGKIFVAGGFEVNDAAPVSNNQVYNPATNTWTTAAAMPTPVLGGTSAVVNGLLYVIGGYEGSSQTPTNVVQIYNPSTNKWTTGKAMPTARGSIAAAVDGDAIYVVGGNGTTLRLDTVEKYVPSTNTWTEEAPLLKGKSEPAAGLVGSTIVAADGYTTSGDTGDNEGYNVSTNKWSALTADPTPRNASCFGSVSGQLYVAGGINNANPQVVTTTNESFSVTTNKWTTQAAMPTAALWQGSAVGNGQLYCVGGQATRQEAVISNVQIYQP